MAKGLDFSVIIMMDFNVRRNQVTVLISPHFRTGRTIAFCDSSNNTGSCFFFNESVKFKVLN